MVGLQRCERECHIVKFDDTFRPIQATCQVSNLCCKQVFDMLVVLDDITKVCCQAMGSQFRKLFGRKSLACCLILG